MEIKRLKTGEYEAIASINSDVYLNDGFNIPVELAAFGGTHYEAIKKCLKKVYEFINPSFEADDDSDEVAENRAEEESRELDKQSF